MLTLIAVTVILFLIAALASAEKSPPRSGGRAESVEGSIGLAPLAVPSADHSPPRKALPPPCEVQCLQAKLAASEKKSVKRLKGWDRANRRAANLRRSLLHQGSVTEALNLACATYGHCSELWRKARCESRFSPTAHNASGASGLFQFLPSTFRSTPYAGLSIWSPYANAMAAGWMHVHGRSGEWVCR